ncbi:Trafficking protein [Vigna angularis]|uniref:Trafficking protein n=1 Tax=Phaseolus angularis TaxID=3914 RepID=A0A8T0LHE5_PHAAN|nr:Trafficking protein [Vigna angularis]
MGFTYLWRHALIMAFLLALHLFLPTLSVIKEEIGIESGTFPHRNLHHSLMFDSPFEVQPWDSGSLRFKFVLGGAPPSPSEDFQSNRKTLGVVGIVHCPSSSDLDAAVDLFTNVCKSFPSSLVDRCFAFCPNDSQVVLRFLAAVMKLTFVAKISYAFFLALSTGIIYSYYAVILKVDEEEFGGHGALLQEGLFAYAKLFQAKLNPMAQVEERDEIRKLRETEAHWTELPGGSPSGRARGPQRN